MAMNLHNIVGNALTIVDDWQQMIFTKTSVRWEMGQRDPVTDEEIIVLQGKMQPANMTEIYEMGVNLTDYEYYKIFVTGSPTTLCKLDQEGADTFICGNYKYKVIGVFDWDDAGWGEAYCYKIEKVGL